MGSLVKSHTNATRIGWHLREIDLRFAHGLPPGWDGGDAFTGFKLPWREDGPPNHHDDTVDSDQ